MKWGSIIRFALESFGPLLVFVLLEHTWGLVPAIVSGVVLGVVLVAFQIWRERKPSMFTIFVAASVAVFGALDLHYRTGFFVKLEPALGNAVTALFFLGTVVVGRPIIVEFARRQRPDIPDSALPYLKNITIAWGCFFIARSIAYVWMAYRLTLDQALAIRGVAGPASFGVMIVGEIGVRKLVFGKKLVAPVPP